MNATLRYIIFFVLASAVFAQVGITEPEEDAILPEATQEVVPMEFVDEEALQQMNDQAHAKASAYLEKAGVNACSKLSDDTAQEVKDNIKAQQAILDKMDKGANCPKEGQAGVNTMKDKLKAAENTSKDATKKYNDALNVDVKFGKHKFNSLTEGNCATLFNSAAYTNAKKKVANAKKAKEQAASRITQAQSDLKAAEAAARASRIICQCDTYKNHQQALKAANAKVKAANTKAWTEAAHLKCVLAGKTMKQCTVPPLPRVEATSLALGVSQQTCYLQGHKQCHTATMTSSSDSQITITSEANDNWLSGCFMRSQVPAKRKHEYMLETKWSLTGYVNSDAMWGFEQLKKGEQAHYFPAINYAVYCWKNANMYIYEKGQGRGNTNCNCGTSARVRIFMQTNGLVYYQMWINSIGGWRTCYTSSVKANNAGYVIDSSIYRKNAQIEMDLFVKGKNGKWMRPTDLAVKPAK